MNKTFTAIFSVILVLFIFSGCAAQGSEKLASSFDESKVKTAAERAINLINSGDYQKISDSMVREDLRKSISADVLKKAADQVMSKAGSFDSFSNEIVAGINDAKAKQDYAVATVAAKYKSQTVTYTISFDTKMNIVGFYLK
nr:DUF3887 domain-containing protein [uncultured Caproiciproducens sp.]